MKLIIKLLAMATLFMAGNQAFAGGSCYSPYQKRWVPHGEVGAKKCCWHGDWKHKSKCYGGGDRYSCYSDYDCGHGKYCKNPGRYGYCKHKGGSAGCGHKNCWSPYLRKCVKHGSWGKYKKCSWGEWK